MKIQVLQITIILALFNFETYLLGSSRYSSKPKHTKQSLSLENARLTTQNLQLQSRLAEIKDDHTVVEVKSVRAMREEALSDGDSELGRRRARSDSASLPKDEDFIEFNRGISNNLDRLTDVHVQNSAFQKKVYDDMKCSRRIAIVGTVVTITYTTAGFIWQNWPAINAYFGGGRHDSPGSGAGSNSTGV